MPTFTRGGVDLTAPPLPSGASKYADTPQKYIFVTVTHTVNTAPPPPHRTRTSRPTGGARWGENDVGAMSNPSSSSRASSCARQLRARGGGARRRGLRGGSSRTAACQKNSNTGPCGSAGGEGGGEPRHEDVDDGPSLGEGEGGDERRDEEGEELKDGLKFVK
jgi:hypothetical protein